MLTIAPKTIGILVLAITPIVDIAATTPPLGPPVTLPPVMPTNNGNKYCVKGSTSNVIF